jgi:hypothetical protein
MNDPGKFFGTRFDLLVSAVSAARNALITAGGEEGAVEHCLPDESDVRTVLESLFPGASSGELDFGATTIRQNIQFALACAFPYFAPDRTELDVALNELDKRIALIRRWNYSAGRDRRWGK